MVVSSMVGDGSEAQVLTAVNLDDTRNFGADFIAAGLRMSADIVLIPHITTACANEHRCRPAHFFDHRPYEILANVLAGRWIWQSSMQVPRLSSYWLAIESAKPNLAAGQLWANRGVYNKAASFQTIRFSTCKHFPARELDVLLPRSRHARLTLPSSRSFVATIIWRRHTMSEAAMREQQGGSGVHELDFLDDPPSNNFTAHSFPYQPSTFDMDMQWISQWDNNGLDHDFGAVANPRQHIQSAETIHNPSYQPPTPQFDFSDYVEDEFLHVGEQSVQPHLNTAGLAMRNTAMLDDDRFISNSLAMAPTNGLNVGLREADPSYTPDGGPAFTLPSEADRFIGHFDPMSLHDSTESNEWDAQVSFREPLEWSLARGQLCVPARDTSQQTFSSWHFCDSSLLFQNTQLELSSAYPQVPSASYSLAPDSQATTAVAHREGPLPSTASTPQALGTAASDLSSGTFGHDGETKRRPCAKRQVSPAAEPTARPKKQARPKVWKPKLDQHSNFQGQWVYVPGDRMSTFGKTLTAEEKAIRANGACIPCRFRKERVSCVKRRLCKRILTLLGASASLVVLRVSVAPKCLTLGVAARSMVFASLLV